MEPYWRGDGVELYLGDMREVLPALGITADLIVADPPYAETSLAWDRWPDGWPALATTAASSMWCFGSMRMFLDRRDEFAAWKLSQDVIWQKPLGTSLHPDRFRRVHENALHWYRGGWRDQHRAVPRDAWFGASNGRRNKGAAKGAHLGEAVATVRQYEDTGTRLMRSIIEARNVRGGIHPTEKPIGILTPLIEYACPPGGLVVDPFAGSGSTLEAARLTGRRAVGIERHEPYAEAAAKRLAQTPLELA